MWLYKTQLIQGQHVDQEERQPGTEPGAEESTVCRRPRRSSNGEGQTPVGEECHPVTTERREKVPDSGRMSEP